LLGYPAVADGEPARLEQTLYALLASESGITQLSDRYSCRLETGLGFDRVVARHYAGESRPLLTREGMPYLVASGFLQRAGARRNLDVYTAGDRDLSGNIARGRSSRG
jgi:hypothetical protein